MNPLDILDDLVKKYPVLESCVSDIQKAFNLLKNCYDNEGTLLICGNGGSAADSEHIVGELMKEFAKKRPLKGRVAENLQSSFGEDGAFIASKLQGALSAIPLTGNIALSTAFANDADPDLIFAQQVNGYGQQTNVVMGISTSGNAKNVKYAVMTANAIGMPTIGLTGKGGGSLKELCDVCICVPAESTPDIQEFHLPVYHAICRMLEEEYF